MRKLCHWVLFTITCDQTLVGAHEGLIAGYFRNIPAFVYDLFFFYYKL